MPPLAPWEEFVRHLGPIVDKLNYEDGVPGLVASLRENINIADYEMFILLRILRSSPDKWTKQQIDFISQNHLDTIIFHILDNMTQDRHKDLFTPQKFDDYIKLILDSLDKKIL